MATALPAPLLLAAELLDRPVLARLLQSALAVLDEIARTSKDPLQRRLAATTIVKVVTQRPPTRPAHQSTHQSAPTPAAKPPAIPPITIAHTTPPHLARDATTHNQTHHPITPITPLTVPLSASPPTLRPLTAPPAPAAALLQSLARSSAP